MVTITLHCPHFDSEALVRDGHAPNGKQKYRCHRCGRRSRENPTPNAYLSVRRVEILQAYQERSSLRGLVRTFGRLSYNAIEYLGCTLVVNQSWPLVGIPKEGQRMYLVGIIRYLTTG